jgi:hypothetical protein
MIAIAAVSGPCDPKSSQQTRAPKATPTESTTSTLFPVQVNPVVGIVNVGVIFQIKGLGSTNASRFTSCSADSEYVSDACDDGNATRDQRDVARESYLSNGVVGQVQDAKESIK